MRKTFQIASIVMILFTSTGMTLGFHYCGKLLQDVALFGKAKPCCGMEMPTGCCHDEHLEIKSDDNSTIQIIAHTGFVGVFIGEINFTAHGFLPRVFSFRSLTVLDKDRPPREETVIRLRSLQI